MLPIQRQINYNMNTPRLVQHYLRSNNLSPSSRWLPHYRNSLRQRASRHASFRHLLLLRDRIVRRGRTERHEIRLVPRPVRLVARLLLFVRIGLIRPPLCRCLPFRSSSFRLRSLNDGSFNLATRSSFVRFRSLALLRSEIARTFFRSTETFLLGRVDGSID